MNTRLNKDRADNKIGNTCNNNVSDSIIYNDFMQRLTIAAHDCT